MVLGGLEAFEKELLAVVRKWSLPITKAYERSVVEGDRELDEVVDTCLDRVVVKFITELEKCGYNFSLTRISSMLKMKSRVR